LYKKIKQKKTQVHFLGKSDIKKGDALRLLPFCFDSLERVKNKS